MTEVGVTYQPDPDAPSVEERELACAVLLQAALDYNDGPKARANSTETSHEADIRYRTAERFMFGDDQDNKAMRDYWLARSEGIGTHAFVMIAKLPVGSIRKRLYSMQVSAGNETRALKSLMAEAA